MSLILDSSMALSWCLRNQANLLSYKIFQRVQSTGAFVPGIWHIEIANILTLKHRDGYLSKSELGVAISLLRMLKIDTDETSRYMEFEELLSVTSKVQLTTYDALYLNLAQRLGLPIATFDKAMLEAARQNRVPLITEA